jgi:hypothetical protein
MSYFARRRARKEAANQILVEEQRREIIANTAEAQRAAEAAGEVDT